MKTSGYNSIKSWGIAVACSLMNCVVVIPWKICPMLFVAFVDRYDTDRRSASLFMIISMVMRCLTGPVVGYLGQVIELKYLCITGCLIASFSTGICFFAEKILFVTIFLGVIYGIGVTLSHTLLPQIIKQHFTKNIVNANGVSLLGSCIGIFAIVPLISFLLNNYGVSGGLLLISGIMLQGVPLSMLLGNPNYKNETTSHLAKVSQEQSVLQSTVCTIPTEHSTCVIDQTNLKKPLAKEQSVEIKAIEENVGQAKVIPTTKYNKVNYVTNETVQYKKQLMDRQQSPIADIPSETGFNGKPLYETEQKIDCVTILEPNPLNKVSEINKKEGKYQKALKTFLIFKNPTYLVIMLCQSLHIYVAMCVYTVFVEMSRDKGIDQSLEHFFLMSMLFSEAFGFTCLGWVTDKGFLSVANFMFVLFSCMGLSCCALVFANGFVTMIFACMSHGLSSAAIYSANPALVYAFVEDGSHTMAIASRVLLLSPLSFTVAPLIGYFRGTLGSYNGALFLLTGICIGCAFLLVFLPTIAKFTNRKKSLQSP